MTGPIVEFNSGCVLTTGTNPNLKELRPGSAGLAR